MNKLGALLTNYFTTVDTIQQSEEMSLRFEAGNIQIRLHSETEVCELTFIEFGI